jgi:predicted Rossmann-fold nucleotide-binding protein
MAITLPFEEGTNRYVTDELAFEYHYFFTRKFWMMYYCQALVVAPGGVGTMDELFEVLTLKQTGKVQSDLPVVLLGATFWRTIINWEAIVGFGVVSKKDYDDLFFTDSVEEAYAYITTRLTTNPIFEVSAPTSAAAEGVE